VFKALYDQDASGETWLRQLLGMAHSGVEPEAAIPANLGQLLESPQFEFPADPPKSYLEWLIKHPQRLSSPPEAEWRKWGERTQRKRRALLAGDSAIQAEALAQLDVLTLPDRAWWRFEGVTRVDCALLTPSTVVFIEGKRTEMGPSKEICWHQERNQMLRILDCAAVYAQRTDRLHYFVLLVVEKDLVEHDPDRQSEIESVMLPRTVQTSLPHLIDEEQMELLSHYLGVTTWQAIVARFDLGRETLLEEVGVGPTSPADH